MAPTKQQVTLEPPSQYRQKLGILNFRLALRHHPDKNPNLPEEAAKKFQQITSAYETIMAHLKVPGSGWLSLFDATRGKMPQRAEGPRK